MHIWDNRNGSWLAATAALSAGLVGLHAALGWHEPRPLGGATTLGLWLGVGGSALMLYVGLIFVALRQRDRRLPASWLKELGYRTASTLLMPLRLIPAWHLRPRSWWLRAHVWMGLFSVVVIFCHSGYRWGGWLTVSLWVVLMLLVISGVFGLLLQQFLPHALAVRFPGEVPYGQIPHLRLVAKSRANELMTALAPGIPADFAMKVSDQLLGRRSFPSELAVDADFQQVRWRIEMPRLEAEDVEARLAKFAGLFGPKWQPQVAANLLDADPPHNLAVKLGEFLKNLGAGDATAAELRHVLHDRWLENVEKLCRQSLDWNRQEAIHHWLHGWLFVHIPLSLTLLALGVAHAIVALYY
mgnify:CR=1 FL=1